MSWWTDSAPRLIAVATAQPIKHAGDLYVGRLGANDQGIGIMQGDKTGRC
jgi:hypothetical protein